MIFTEGSKFNNFGSDRENIALELKNLKSTLKHSGGNVMVLGAMSTGRFGYIVFVQTTMGKHHYLNILKENLDARAT